jgi:NTE family protein
MAANRPETRWKTAVVLAGGSARGAYEVGVIDYVLKDVARALGRDVPIDILCGTSAGAINACFLAAHADAPSARADRLTARWLELRIDEVIRPSTSEIFGMIGSLFGKKRPPPKEGEERRGGLLDPTGVEHMVVQSIPFSRIAEHMRAGLLSGLTVSTTHVASGTTVVFVERPEPGLPPWSRDPTMSARRAEIGPDHALASAAVPLLFPAVRIDGEFYCDGGLRQNVPLSPARRLGADGLIVVNPRYIGPPATPSTNVAQYPAPLALFGKALNALLLDRIENDIDRLNRINAILEAGTSRFGNAFLEAVNQKVGDTPRGGLRSLRVVHIRASEDIGVMAAEHVRTPEFAARTAGWISRVLRRIGASAGEADLLSYVLFDGAFAAKLIDLGRRDARAQHDALCAFFGAAMGLTTATPGPSTP